MPAVALTAVPGCANDNSLLRSAQKVHSYTPCGMLMDAMMPHSMGGQDDQTAETGTLPQLDSDTSTPDDRAEDSVHHAD